MVDEKKILAAAIKSRKAWELLNSNVSPAELGSDTATLLGIVREYYERDSSAQTVDIPLVIASVERSVQNPKHQKMLRTVLETLPEVSSENLVHEILELKRHNAGLKLASALQRGSKDLKNLLDDYNQWFTKSADGWWYSDSDEEEVIEKFQVSELVKESYDPEKLVPILPRSLNDRLGGGARWGHHILVFAPTEMGKTLLLINMLAGWVKAKLPVLYVGNEDPVEDLMMRYINRLTSMTKAEVLAQPDRAQALLEKRGYEHVVFAPLAPGNFTTIRRLVDRYGPKVVVLDQLRNIDVDSENRTQALEKAATEARNLAKSKQIVVVSVSQAADSASGKRILTRGDVDGSNIGIPGQMDVMIGLGATEEDEQRNIRWLSFPKNKVSGNHEAIQIEIDPQLSMVVEHQYQ